MDLAQKAIVTMKIVALFSLRLAFPYVFRSFARLYSLPLDRRRMKAQPLIAPSDLQRLETALAIWYFE
ncbi:hypothetical protein [Paenibacillus cymbidii]|uniref:hypothetical protein n=1 Tax=Paenibacillus cymbidii TaxID=1639034 RepID=UPI0010820D19|nr:hypothetical protein [Paenibacillus cymbidii]